MGNRTSEEYIELEEINKNKMEDMEIEDEELIILDKSAVSTIKDIANVLERHEIFRDIVNDKDSLIIEGLEKSFERKYGMLIVTNVKSRLYETDLYIIGRNEVIYESNYIVRTVIGSGYNKYKYDDSIHYMLQGYPVTLLSKVCEVEETYSYMIGESVKMFVEIRKQNPYFLPKELYNVIEGALPLEGHSKSPLTKNELDALYRYLGSKKSIYVHILLNCLHELGQHNKILEKFILTGDEMIEICKSSWVFIFLWALKYNVK